MGHLQPLQIEQTETVLIQKSVKYPLLLTFSRFVVRCFASNIAVKTSLTHRIFLEMPLVSQNRQFHWQQYQNNRLEVDICSISESALFQFARFGGVGGGPSRKPPGILGRNPSYPTY